MACVSEVTTVSETHDATSRRSAPLRALVVDDDHCLRQVVQQMLEVLEFRADSANGGHAAIRCLSQSRYDLMVTDLQMPDMDGYELSSWLKIKSKDTKVIVMTGSNHADVVNYMNTGIVDRWMFKPFSLTKLAGIVGELVPTDCLSPFANAKINVGHPGSAYDGGQRRRPQPVGMKAGR
jgi:two-component system capsular synthesis sensor histidine kinase RcsC